MLGKKSRAFCHRLRGERGPFDLQIFSDAANVSKKGFPLAKERLGTGIAGAFRQRKWQATFHERAERLRLWTL